MSGGSQFTQIAPACSGSRRGVPWQRRQNPPHRQTGLRQREADLRSWERAGTGDELSCAG